MQIITVAIADEDAGRRAKFENCLQGVEDIMVLKNATSSEGEMTIDRRLNPRKNISAIENIVAMMRRLNPRILIANYKQCTDEDCAMLVSLRRECPETLVVLLADESVQQEEQVMQALASGARGYLSPESDSRYLLKAVHVIDRGEAWVPRKMLGKIMDQVLQWCLENSIEVHLDPAS